MTPGARDEVRIRVANPGDASAVSTVISTSYASEFARSYAPDILASLLPVISDANPVLLAGGTYYVAETVTGIVGCGGWSAERPGTGDRELGLMHIRHFAVMPDTVGRGVGRAIFKRCLADAALLGFSRVEVYSSLNAEGFYAAMGCRGVGQRVIGMPGGAQMPVVVMRRDV